MIREVFRRVRLRPEDRALLADEIWMGIRNNKGQGGYGRLQLKRIEFNGGQTMNDRAFLFPGQGSQAVGMGLDLFEKSEFAKKTFRQADEILGYPLSRICFNGPGRGAEADLQYPAGAAHGFLYPVHAVAKGAAAGGRAQPGGVFGPALRRGVPL